jgi:hypothetical protein
VIDVVCCAQCKWTAHRWVRLLIFCHRTASLKFCKYLVSQSKFYLPREQKLLYLLHVGKMEDTRLSESVNRRWTDNTMAKRRWTNNTMANRKRLKGQIMIYKTLHWKLKSKQHVPIKTGGELTCSERVRRICSTSDIRPFTVKRHVVHHLIRKSCWTPV